MSTVKMSLLDAGWTDLSKHDNHLPTTATILLALLAYWAKMGVGIRTGKNDCTYYKPPEFRFISTVTRILYHEISIRQ
jgi:hypothetical protein